MNSRQYNVMRLVEDPRLSSFGRQFQLNATPMPHHEACTFLSKMTKYKWCRDFLQEIA